MGNRRVLAFLCSCTLSACGSSGPQVARVGGQAPSWTEPLSRGQTLSLAQLRGKAVYLNFFATWCPPCNEEAPAIEALSRTYADRGLEVVGVDELENAGQAARFRAEHRLSYPIVVDQGTLRDQYRINDLPVHVFIGRDGIVRRITVGELSPVQMREAVESVLQ